MKAQTCCAFFFSGCSPLPQYVIGVGEKPGAPSLKRKEEGLKEAVMCRADRDCFIGGVVKDLRSEVKGGSCIIGVESEV